MYFCFSIFFLYFFICCLKLESPSFDTKYHIECCFRMINPKKCKTKHTEKKNEMKEFFNCWNDGKYWMLIKYADIIHNNNIRLNNAFCFLLCYYHPKGCFVTFQSKVMLILNEISMRSKTLYDEYIVWCVPNDAGCLWELFHRCCCCCCCYYAVKLNGNLQRINPIHCISCIIQMCVSVFFFFSFWFFGLRKRRRIRMRDYCCVKTVIYIYT